MEIDKQAAQGFRCPRWDELPGLGLYMDQVIIVLEQALAIFQDEKDRVVTSTMINNYVKQKMLPPPVKKKYDRSHVATLVVVGVMKRVLSMGEIAAIMDMLTGETGIERAYDLFCQMLDDTVHGVFLGEGINAQYSGRPAEDALAAAMAALGGKLMVQWLIRPH